MTATDELRKLLDERGVEWTAPNSILRDTMTCWTAGGFYYEAFEVPEPDGTFLLTAAHQDDLTPAQAIEATLGRGECRVYLDGNENYKAYRCDACGMQAVRWGDYCPSCGRRVVEVSE